MGIENQWSRRRFVLAAAAGAGALLVPPYLRASSRRIAPGGTLRMGVATLPPDTLADAGMDLGMQEAVRTAQLFGWKLELVRPSVAPSDIVADLRALAAAGARVVVTAVGDAQLAAMAPVAEQLGILLVNGAAPADSLRGCGRLLFHVAPSRSMLVDAAARWLAPGKPQRLAVLAAGDAVSTALADRFDRVFASEGGGAPTRRALPAAGDASSYSALVGTADVFVVIGPVPAADALIAGWQRGGPHGGPILVDLADRQPRRVDDPDPPRPSGVAVLQPVAWHGSLERFGADQLNQRYRRVFHWAMEESAWGGWAAMKIAVEAAIRAGSGEPSAIAAYLAGGAAEFDGQKGWPLSFRPWDHQLRQPIYLAEGAPNAGHVVDELPAAPRGATRDSARVLDSLGVARGEAACKVRT